MTILILFLFLRVLSSEIKGKISCDAPVANQRSYWEQVGIDAALWGLDVLPSLGGIPLPTNVFLENLPGLSTGGFNSDNIAILFEAAECYSRAIDGLNQRVTDLEESMNKHICDESQLEVDLTYSDLVREVKNVKDNIISDHPLACGFNTKTKQLEGVCTGGQFRHLFLDKVEARFDNVAELIKRLTLQMSGPENVNCLKCTSSIYNFEFLHSWTEECEAPSRANGGNGDCVLHEDRRIYSVEECLGDSKWQEQFMNGYYNPVVNAITMVTNLWAEVVYVGKLRNDLDFQGLVDDSDMARHYEGIFKAFDEFRTVTREHLYWQSGGSNLPPGFTLPAECNELAPGDAFSWKRSPVQDTCPVEGHRSLRFLIPSRDCGMETATCVAPLSLARDRIDASLKQHQEWLSGTFSPFHNQLCVATITDLYESILCRNPDITGLNNWVNACNDGSLTIDQIELELRNSDEFQGCAICQNNCKAQSNTYVTMDSTGKCPEGSELTEEQCEMAHGYGSGWGEAGTYELPESCGCYIDQNDGKRYFNRLTGACNQADDGEKLVCLRNALYVTVKSTGKCPTRTGLTEEQCKSADKFGSSWGGAGTFDLPETCGCYIDQDGKRYFNRMTGACNDPDDGEFSICLQSN